jgi:prefoldin subunit 4
LEGLDDACTELMMGPAAHDDDDDDDDDDDENNIGTKTNTSTAIMILQGESFFETNEDDATAYCETRIEKLQKQLDQLNQEDQDILAQQSELKTLLYGRFGKSINLEAD